MPAACRLCILLVLLVSSALAAGAAAGAPGSAQPSPAETKAAVIPEMMFYLARGEADACGRGCSEWIAADGRIDAGAAQRLRRLLAKLGSRRLPIYFHSPGGSVLGSLALGRLIRERKLQGGVARAIPSGCEREKPWEKSCTAQKRSGQELASEFDPSGMCNSACVFALAGTVARAVPPGVKLAIHDIGLDPRREPLPAAIAAKAKQLAYLRIQEYLREMGIDSGLLRAIIAVPNESRRFLEREELVRFGIDRREFGETSWRFSEHPKPAIGKVFFARFGGEHPQYRTGLVRLDCPSGQEIRILLAREHVSSEVSRTRPFSISVGEQRLELHYPTFSTDFDTRSTWLAGQRFDSVGDGTRFEVRAIDISGGTESPGNIALSLDGFSHAYAKLRGACRQAPAAGQMPVGAASNAPTTRRSAAVLAGTLRLALTAIAWCQRACRAAVRECRTHGSDRTRRRTPDTGAFRTGVLDVSASPAPMTKAARCKSLIIRYVAVLSASMRLARA
jgi:hypothetical protein